MTAPKKPNYECTDCGGVFAACARDMFGWVKRHVSKRWSKGDFYGAAVNSARVP